MKTSAATLNKIAEFEGIRLKAYRCPAGVLTIGVGHTGADVKEGMEITREQAMELFRQDIAKFEKYVTATGLELTQNQFDALVSFAYNCGAGNLQKLVKGRNYQQIGNAMLLYDKAKGRVLPGLTRRRQWEKALFLSDRPQLKPIPTVAQEVIDGKWGNGIDRKNRLHAAGYDYATVQKEVNRMLRGK